MALSIPKSKNSAQSVNSFAQDVDAGLSADKKFIPPKYFYDTRGDQLFRDIMALPEYYLTRAEHGILTNYRQELLDHFSRLGPFGLYELGAGDGMKTKVLLRHFTAGGARFEYLPIDISRNALSGLVRSLAAEFPNLAINPMAGDYFSVLSGISQSKKRKVVLFLGASIGNFEFADALDFLKELRNSLSKDDLLLTGFDLKKNPHEILSAYNDSKGITRDFNLNLLRRINSELGADFDLSQFSHYPTYDPLTGEAKSFLVSQIRQQVRVTALGKTFDFAEGEAIHTEISRKYSLAEIDLLAELSGFVPVRNFSDPKNRFVNALWKRSKNQRI